VIGVVLRGVLDDFRVYCEVLYCCFVMVWCYLVLEGGIRLTDKRFRMVTIDGMGFPFIVDNESANKRTDTITSYRTYETHKNDKCLELVELLNALHEENTRLKEENKQLNHDLDLYEENNTNEVLNKLRIELTSRMNDCIEEFKE
jgi:hypothetical protein